MEKCTKCGTNFVGTPEQPPADGLCKYCEIEKLKAEVEVLKFALEESAKLHAHYATLLNQWDGGCRLIFPNADAWMNRLRDTKAIPQQ